MWILCLFHKKGELLEVVVCNFSVSCGENKMYRYENTCLKPSFTWPLSIIYDTQFQTKKMFLNPFESIIVS